MFGDEVEMDDVDLAEIDALAARHYAKSEAEGLRERCRRSTRPAHQRPLLRGYLADPAEADDPPRLELYCSHPPPDGLDEVLRHYSGGQLRYYGDGGGMRWPCTLPLAPAADPPVASWESLLRDHFDDATVSMPPTPMLAELCAPPPPPAELERRLRAIPRALYETLYEYQRHAVAFALSHGPATLLADEMGLGKSLQALAIASACRESWPLLIVCPSSARSMWHELVEQWLPAVPCSRVCVLTRCWDMVCNRCAPRRPARGTPLPPDAPPLAAT